MRYLLYSVFTLIVFTLSACHVGRFFIWNFADANDYKKFPKVDIQHVGEPFHFIESPHLNALELPDSLKEGKKIYEFEKALDKSGTVAFMVIRNDSILYEKYFDNRKQESIHPSFSMSKSVTSMLVGIAIHEGKIKSVEEPITKYLPELPSGEGFEKITIEHLLDMRSGIKFNEGYFNPFGDVAKFYYGRNIKKYISKLKIGQAPDKSFHYQSIDTQLLGLIVENATKQPIAKYLEEKVWQHLGMEYDASWSIDSKKNLTVKAFCCLNARARDFAKLGLLYLNKGNWNGKQIVPESWVNTSTTFDKPKNMFMYSYQWWHNQNVEIKTDSTELPKFYSEREVTVVRSGNKSKESVIFSPYPDFFAQGILGQFIYVHPEKNIVIVRLGKKYGGVSWGRLFKNIAEMN